MIIEAYFTIIAFLYSLRSYWLDMVLFSVFTYLNAEQVDLKLCVLG